MTDRRIGKWNDRQTADRHEFLELLFAAGKVEWPTNFHSSSGSKEVTPRILLSPNIVFPSQPDSEQVPFWLAEPTSTGRPKYS